VSCRVCAVHVRCGWLMFHRYHSCSCCSITSFPLPAGFPQHCYDPSKVLMLYPLLSISRIGIPGALRSSSSTSAAPAISRSALTPTSRAASVSACLACDVCCAVCVWRAWCTAQSACCAVCCVNSEAQRSLNRASRNRVSVSVFLVACSSELLSLTIPCRPLAGGPAGAALHPKDRHVVAGLRVRGNAHGGAIVRWGQPGGPDLPYCGCVGHVSDRDDQSQPRESAQPGKRVVPYVGCGGECVW
jgi:hypothetical protein